VKIQSDAVLFTLRVHCLDLGTSTSEIFLYQLKRYDVLILTHQCYHVIGAPTFSLTMHSIFKSISDGASIETPQRLVAFG
jgi:hypothetical protein